MNEPCLDENDTAHELIKTSNKPRAVGHFNKRVINNIISQPYYICIAITIWIIYRREDWKTKQNKKKKSNPIIFKSEVNSPFTWLFIFTPNLRPLFIFDFTTIFVISYFRGTHIILYCYDGYRNTSHNNIMPLAEKLLLLSRSYTAAICEGRW